MRYRAVLFDLDGTLVDSIPDIAQAVNHMLEEMGHPTLSPQKISTFLGKGMDHLIWLALNELTDAPAPAPEDYQKGRELFAKHYDLQLQQPSSTLFDGVKEGLDAFQAAGCQLAIVTNKPIEFVPALIQHVGIDHYFTCLVGGNTCEEKKPHPMPFLYACEKLGVTPAEALVIGDSSNDSIAAREAGIDVLIVPYGYNEGQSVQKLDCDGIVSNISEAAQWAAQPKGH